VWLTSCVHTRAKFRLTDFWSQDGTALMQLQAVTCSSHDGLCRRTDRSDGSQVEQRGLAPR
jgi:hypothetical protein